MCPTSALMAASTAAGVAGAGVSGFGTFLGGRSAAAAANYSAQVAANNAIIANQNATYASQAGEAQADIAARKGAAVSGKVKAGQAASGIDVNTGSALDVQAGQRETSKLEAETVLNNAELQAYGYRSQATGYTAQAGLEKMEAAQAPVGADIATIGGVLSSASSLGSSWAKFGTTPQATGGGTTGG
jgi:hypothetical protein